jgi:type II secretory pathway component PulK
MLTQPHKREAGIALILVILMIALATALVVALTDSTYVAMRLNAAAERRVKAEYILKSAVNLARVLIKGDKTPFDDPREDAWMQFIDGGEVPGAFIGINEPNVRIQLQITSEGGKIPIRKLVPSGSADVLQRDCILRLFKALGFDNDQQEVDQTGLFQGRHFKSDELVANLIDYMDSDSDSYSAAGFAQGIEGNLPTTNPFRNEPIDSLASELGSIPGFTPARVQRLIPLLTVSSSTRINVNAAPKEVIMALSSDIDDPEAQAIVDFRNPANGGPFTDTSWTTDLTRLAGSSDPNITNLATFKGTYFEVLSKVDYGTSYFMARAILSATNPGELPELRGLDLF